MNTTTPYKETRRLCRSVEQGLCAALVVGVLVFMPPTVTSEMYQYVERNGTLSVTNVPTDQQYQSLPSDSTYLSSRVYRRKWIRPLPGMPSGIGSIRPCCARSSRQRRILFQPRWPRGGAWPDATDAAHCGVVAGSRPLQSDRQYRRGRQIFAPPA